MKVFDLILISKILEHFFRIMNIFFTDGSFKSMLHFPKLPETFYQQICMTNARILYHFKKKYLQIKRITNLVSQKKGDQKNFHSYKTFF